MHVEPSDRVIARIAAARREHPEGIVAFDGDGTLWSGDIGEDFFKAFVAKSDVRASAVAELREEARAHGLSDVGEGAVVAERLYAAYLAGKFPEERMCEVMAWCFGGWSRREVEALADEVVSEGATLAGRLHGEVMRVVEWVRAERIEAFLVSASPRAVVEAAGRFVGIAPSHVVAATSLFEGDTMLPSVDRPIPYGDGKVARLRERAGARPLCAFFGDNAFDVALLKEAHVPIAVRPKPRLRARASEVHLLVEIAAEG